MPYQPGGMLTVGFSDKVPDYDAVKDGSAARRHLPSTAPALVVFGYAFGGRTDDEMLLIIDGPNGLFIQETVKLNGVGPRLGLAGLFRCDRAPECASNPPARPGQCWTG